MKVFFKRPYACALGKNAIYLIGMILWLVVTVMLAARENPESIPDVRSLLMVKLSLLGVVYFGREVLFSHYRRIRWLVFIWGLGWVLLFGGRLFQFSGRNIFLSVLDTMIWSLILALFFEVLSVLFLTWSKLPRLSPLQINQIWERCWRDMLCLGLWMTLATSFFYFYLIRFYLADVLFYRNLFLILVGGLGFFLFALVTYQINHGLAEEIKVIDHHLEPIFQWRELQPDDTLQWLAHYQAWLSIRTYLLSFSRPRIYFKKIFYYLLLLAWLYRLPYIFNALI